MSEMDFFRKPPASYVPITPHAALRAYEEGILPVEQFIYMSTSVQPLDEKQVDISAIERVLARDDLDVQDNLFLIEIFESMIRSKDPEYAVFAAESINLIEARYHQKITILKENAALETNPEIASRIARLYFELGLINEKRTSIKAFYLRESVSHLKGFLDLKYISRDDFILLARILIELGLFELAADVIAAMGNELEGHPYIPFLKAEIAFARHDYDEVFETIKNIHPDSLDEIEADLYTYWLSPHEK
jgi:hypothetical protein